MRTGLVDRPHTRHNYNCVIRQLIAGCRNDRLPFWVEVDFSVSSIGELQSLPTVLFQIDSAGRVQPDSFFLQAHALFMISRRRPQTDFAAGIDDAVPRHLVWATAHRPTDCSGCTRSTQRSGNLAVRDDASAGHSPNERIYSREKIRTRGRLRTDWRLFLLHICTRTELSAAGRPLAAGNSSDGRTSKSQPLRSPS